MGSGDIVYRLTAEEGRAVEGFLKTARAMNQVERGTEQATRKTKRYDAATRRMSRRAIGDLKSMALGFASIGTAIAVGRAAWRLWQKDIADAVNSMKEFQSEFINLQFLGQHFKDPKFRERVHRLAKVTGIAGPELAKGIYGLESMTGWMGKLDPAERGRRRSEMLTEMIKVRKAGNVPMEELVPTFAKMGAIYQQLNARELANITHKLIEQAAVVSPGELSATGPRIFAAGQMGRIDARTAAAIAAIATGKAGTTRRAAAGMEISLRKIMLADPDEQEAIRKLAYGAPRPTAGREGMLKGAGITAEDNAYTRLLKLANVHRRKQYSTQQLKDLFGERGMLYGRRMLSDPAALKAMVHEFKTTTGAEADLVGKKLGVVFKTDPVFRMLEAGARATAAIEATQQRPEKMVWQNLDLAFERIRKERDAGLGTKMNLGMYVRKAQAQTWMGGGQVETARWALKNALLSYGYIKSDDFEQRQREADRMASEWLGLEPREVREAAQDLKEAAKNIFEASVELKAATDKTPVYDAHAE